MKTCLMSVLAAGVAVSLFAGDWFVVPPGTPGVPDNPDYLSWATAGTNIHEAVYLSNTVPAADNTKRAQQNRLFVKSGIYIVTNQLNLVDCRYEIRSSKGPDAQDELDRNGTILCGGYPATTNRIFNVSAGSAARECFIRGLTITNGWVGYRTSAGRNANEGGGVRFTGAASSSKTGVYDCNIVGNTAFCGAGGGVATTCFGGVISNCFIACNLATNVWDSGWNTGDFGGGGVSFNEPGGAGVNRSTRTYGARIFDCIISNNLATGNAAAGSGIRSGRAGHWIEGCYLVDNRVVGSIPGNAANGGTIWCDRFARIYNCVVTNNTRGSNAPRADIVCGTCAIVSNCTVVASVGGVWVGDDVQGTVTQPSEIVSCYFDGLGTGQDGVKAGAHASVRNCYVTGYTGDNGAISQPSDSCLFENCTIVRNYRGVRTGAAQLIPFSNCVFDNRYIKNSQDISVPGTHSKPGVTLTNCWFYAKNRINADTPNTNCVFSTTPGFVDMANGDYHLTKKSILRDAGVKNAWMTGATDFEGNPRLIDHWGKASAEALPDLGCYECTIGFGGMLLLLR